MFVKLSIAELKVPEIRVPVIRQGQERQDFQEIIQVNPRVIRS